VPDDPTKPDQTDDFGKLEALLKDVRFTMFTTRADGRLRSRPMTTIKTDDVGRLWFLTDRDADIAQDILREPSVGLSYADNGSSTYVSVSGHATWSEDRRQIERLWNPAMKAWWSGPDDPKIVAIDVRVDAAEYWDGPNSRIVRLFAILAAAATGREFEGGEHGEVTRATAGQRTAY
jgi:general stress protein 26